MSSNQHRIRLSIDISGLKQHSFRGLIYAHYSQQPDMGIKQQFRTTPALEVTKTMVEHQFSNSFASYIFECDKDQLLGIFEQPFQVSIFHQDRMKKNLKLGIASISLQELLKSPIRKTAQSYVRVMDAFFPIDEVSESDNVNVIGALRVIFYLEDLGPIDQIQQQETDTQNQIFQDPALPIIRIPNSDDPEKQKLVLELNSLEHKVIWELETWKKSEEAKFKVILKQKEYEMTAKLYNEFKLKDQDRERSLKQYLAQVQLAESKIKQKANDLQKREQKIISLEEELKSKLLETAKIVKSKDEEMGALVKKQKDLSLQYEKDKTLLNLKLGDAEALNNRYEDDIAKLKKELDKSPVALVKNTIQEKTIEINDLKKEIDKERQMKEKYKQYYEKMRDELLKQKQINEQLQQSQQSNALLEIEKLKQELTQVRVQQLQPQPQQSSIVKQEKQDEPINPFKQALVNPDNERSSIKYKSQQFTQSKQVKPYPSLDQPALQRLIQERDYLLESGEYTENDALIQELNKQILELS